MTQPNEREALADGIYFNLPGADYLACDRLSKSGIKRMRVSPADYWADSHLNPTPVQLTPDQERQRYMARVIGRAYHCARLEPDRFAQVYVREISPADFTSVEGFLSTGREIEAALADMGLSKKSKDDAGVLDQARRLVAAGYPHPVWHLIEDEWREGLQPGQVVIPAKAYDEIRVDMERIRAVPAVHQLLSGGAAEVSVLYTCPETGIPMRARFDYLRADCWVEFKTFANSSRKALPQAIIDAVRFERYHIDAAGYMEAAEVLRSGVLPVIGAASDDQLALVDAIQSRALPLDCHFVFQQKGGVPNILARKWRFFEPSRSDVAIAELERAGAHPDKLAAARHFREVSGAARTKTALYVKGRMEIAAAKRDYLAYSEIYQPGEPWLPFNPLGEITDDDFSQHFLEEAI